MGKQVTSCPKNNLTEAIDGLRRINIRCPINDLTEREGHLCPMKRNSLARKRCVTDTRPRAERKYEMVILDERNATADERG